MKITLLLKSGPGTKEADRALQTAADMIGQGHTVSLFLMQEAVHFCCLHGRRSKSTDLGELLDRKLDVHVLAHDPELWGIDLPGQEQAFVQGWYDSLIALLESSGASKGQKR